ncbi:hypothetical protein QUF72_05640 [Desulfobacterales bacterium HSG2]|nr:hypothetical protein [Desulfobacterales bacterium HSG2]
MKEFLNATNINSILTAVGIVVTLISIVISMKKGKEILAFWAEWKKRKLGKESKLTVLLFISLYFILTFVSWVILRPHDWNCYKLLSDRMNPPELSQDVVLADVPYPDEPGGRLTFRKNVGQFLQELAKAKPDQRPLVVGLDIVYRAFEQNTRKPRTATRELIKGVNALTKEGIPVIAAYDPRKSETYYEKKLFKENTPFTDIGHNLISARDGKFHAKVFEPLRDKSDIGTELKIFFAALMVRYGYPLAGEDFPMEVEKTCQNILPILYQKNFKFQKVEFDEKQAFPYEMFAKKAVIIGNKEKDYKEEADFYGLHAVAYATQLLIDHARNKDVLMVFILSEWLIILTAFAFSLLEYFLFRGMLNGFSIRFSYPIASSAALTCSLLLTASIFLGAVYLASKADYLFADFAIVLSGILVSGILCFVYQFRQIFAVLVSRETHRAESGQSVKH